MSEGRGGGAFWWAVLNHVRGVGAATMLRLARAFGSAEAAAHAPTEDLVARGGLTPEQAEQVSSLAATPEVMQERLSRYARHGITLLVTDDPEYPRPLLDLPNPPPLLYVQGHLLPQDTRAVAVVGTRTPDAEGEQRATGFAQAFTARGYTIVSGLARGIDTAGHRGALAVEQGRTVAFLGCGLLRIYPPENVGLAGQIARRGALLSEVPPETEVNRGLLLARDRLQAGLSRAVIVVQAHRKCGSLVAARHARRCQRLIFGVPWDEPPYSEGWEELQKLGARPITPESDLDQLIAQMDALPPPSQPTLL